MTLPPLTSALIERLEHATLTKGISALKRAAQFPGNPYDVDVFELSGILATRVGRLSHLPWYNALTGLGDDNLHLLDEALAAYPPYTVVPTITMWATRLSPAVGAALFDRGFTARGVGTTLYAMPGATSPTERQEIEVVEIAGGERSPTFDEVLLAGYEFDHPVQRSLAVLENENPEVRRYLALIGGEPAAVAALTQHDGIAYLAGAATLPRFRGRGAQTALIRRRLSDALAQSELVVVTTTFTSPSQRNLERLGFRLAHLKTIWASRSNLDQS
jgi:ribosomal protein S18 acetylase RimI-like enzyme